jgi:FtsP/CotA-like multicopper oxidase with cupredoxin domain
MAVTKLFLQNSFFLHFRDYVKNNILIMKKNNTLQKTVLLAFCLFFALKAYAQPNFINKLPIPPLIDIPANGTITLEMGVSYHKFNPAMPSDTINGISKKQPKGITTYSYNIAGSKVMSILAPTLKWHTRDSINIYVSNKLPDTTTTHWHGAEIPPYYDGGPHQMILPNTTWKTHFRVLDSASTFWYHPHLHDKTVEQVSMGLSGMIILEQKTDAIGEKLPRTYGVDDIPIIIGDLGVTRVGKDSMIIVTAMGKRPFNLVNGVNSPYLNVPANIVRFRVLNGSTRKGIMFGFRTSQDSTSVADSLITFKQIATDGGYTLASNPRKWMLHGPGSRDEIVIDFSKYLNKTLYMVNLNGKMPTTIVGAIGTNDPTRGKAFLKINVVSNDSFPNYKPVTVFKDFKKDWEPELRDPTGAYERPTKHLYGNGKGKGYTIDSSHYHLDDINDVVCENTKEIWTIKNASNVAHPFHIHKIQFRILSIVDGKGVSQDLTALGLNGPKDDVLILPGWTLKFLGNFSDYGYDGPDVDSTMAKNTYMYHCHILTHEDAIGGGMMHQFLVKKSPCKPSVGGTHVATKDAMALPKMLLYPNPTSGELHLRGTSDEPSSVFITDITGRVLSKQNLPPFSEDILLTTDNISQQGLLFVLWKTERGTVTQKVMFNQN